VDEDLGPEITQLGHDIHHPCVAQVGHVFLEGEPQDADAAVHDPALGPDELLDRGLGHARVPTESLMRRPAG
jgi:hypothetical protein